MRRGRDRSAGRAAFTTVELVVASAVLLVLLGLLPLLMAPLRRAGEGGRALDRQRQLRLAAQAIGDRVAYACEVLLPAAGAAGESPYLLLRDGGGAVVAAFCDRREGLVVVDVGGWLAGAATAARRLLPRATAFAVRRPTAGLCEWRLEMPDEQQRPLVLRDARRPLGGLP